MLLDLVKFVLWLKQRGLKLEDLDEKRLKELASEFWDMLHGED
jgi:hypothetical protein